MVVFGGCCGGEGDMSLKKISFTLECEINMVRIPKSCEFVRPNFGNSHFCKMLEKIVCEVKEIVNFY